MHFCPPPRVCHPHFESTPPNVLIHAHYVRASHAERLAKNFSHDRFIIPSSYAYIPPQRVSHCPFSNNVGYALTACLLCARKVLPIQGFPFRIARLFLRHTSSLHNRQGPALTCRAGSATPRHMLKTSLIKKGLPKGDYRIQIYFSFNVNFPLLLFFPPHTQQLGNKNLSQGG